MVDYSVEVQLTLFTKHHFSACGICPHFISGIYPTADIITCRGKLCFPLQPSTHLMYNSQGCHGFYMTGYGFVVSCLGFLSHSQNLVCRPLGLSTPVFLPPVERNILFNFQIFYIRRCGLIVYFLYYLNIRF